MANKKYCWSMGTTSFRASHLNFKIEMQLNLLEEFWKLHPNKTWNDSGDKILEKKLKMTDKEKYTTQVLFYNFLKEHEFLDGEASIRDKDARAKTSGLVDLGLLTKDRKLTDIGCFLKQISNQPSKGNNIFKISDDSYIYLLQFLKMKDKNFKIKPFMSLIYMIEKLGYVTQEEFTYLLPLCKNKNDVFNMVETIKLNRMGLNIDEIIETKMFDIPKYFEMCNEFINTYPVTEETFEYIGMSGKSKQYDRNYKKVYDLLVDLVFHLKNNSFEERKDKYEELYNFCADISGNAGKHWKNYLFFGYKKSNMDEVFDKKFKEIYISTIKNIKDFKKEFFSKLHVIKWKVNLEDYFDLNRRYFSLTDIIKFNDSKIELDLLPKYFFKDKIEKLMNEDLAEGKNYFEIFYSNIPLEEISDLYTTDIMALIKEINNELHTNLTVDNIGTYLEDEKLKAFNNLIDTKFRNENLIEILNNIKNRQDNEVMKSVTDNADVPTIFEYILGIAWYRISSKEGNILKFINLSLDADLLPRTHASGGMADIVYEYNEKTYPKHNLVIEATLSDPNSQRKMELESVPRHLAKNIISTNNNNDYAIFVASIPEESVILSMRSNRYTYYPKGNGEYIKGFKIIPINIDVLIKILSEGINYENIFKWFDNAFKSETVDPEWFDKEILQKI